MTPREIYDEIAGGGPRVKEAIRELAVLIDALSRKPVLSAGGRAFRLTAEQRPDVVNRAWARAVKRFKRGLSRSPSDAAIEVLLRKMLGSISREQSVAEEAAGDRFEELEEAEPSKTGEPVESSSADTRSYWERAIAVVAPLVDAYLDRSRSGDKKKRIQERWSELQSRLVDDESMRQILEARGIVNARTPDARYKQIAQKYYVRHIRFREALERVLAWMERAGRLTRQKGDETRAVLRVLIRVHRPPHD
jgi:hypothetical protein